MRTLFSRSPRTIIGRRCPPVKCKRKRGRESYLKRGKQWSICAGRSPILRRVGEGARRGGLLSPVFSGDTAAGPHSGRDAFVDLHDAWGRPEQAALFATGRSRQSRSLERPSETAWMPHLDVSSGSKTSAGSISTTPSASAPVVNSDVWCVPRCLLQPRQRIGIVELASGDDGPDLARVRDVFERVAAQQHEIG